MNARSSLVFALTAVLLGACAATAPRLTTNKQQISYMIGYRIGQNLKNQNMDIDPRALLQALEDAQSGRPERLSSAQMKAAVATYKHERQSEYTALAQKNLVAGTKFLAENAKKPGVITLASGLEYRVITEGKGRRPKITDTIVANYRGRLIDGTEFDSSYKRGAPATFRLSGVIRGWQQALQLMPVGSTWRIYVPADLAYGPGGAGSVIGPNETLIFDIELLQIR